MFLRTWPPRGGRGVCSLLNAQRQCNHAQTSAAKGIKASEYLSLKDGLAVLCRNNIIPSNPPGQPPKMPSLIRSHSEARQPPRVACHLSRPKAMNAAILNPANQRAANASIFLKRGIILAPPHGTGPPIRRENWLPLLVMLQLSLCQRQVCRLPHSTAKW